MIETRETLSPLAVSFFDGICQPLASFVGIQRDGRHPSNPLILIRGNETKATMAVPFLQFTSFQVLLTVAFNLMRYEIAAERAAREAREEQPA